MYSRRNVINLAIASAITYGARSDLLCAQTSSSDKPVVIHKPIPSTMERLPAVGLGTQPYVFTTRTDEEIAEKLKILESFVNEGGKIVDTAPSYDDSELVIGRFLSQSEGRRPLFLATKISIGEGDIEQSKLRLEQSFRRLGVDVIDLVQVHSVRGSDLLIPILLEYKRNGRIRYFGVTTSSSVQHSEMVDLIRRHHLDFIQVNYSLGNRSAADQVLPAAQASGTAVIANIPFSGRNGRLFKEVANRQLPVWATEFGAHTWAQFFLKYVISHPAVTCTIPGTGKLEHLIDNMSAGRGTLPDATMRRKMETFWDRFT